MAHKAKEPTTKHRSIQFDIGELKRLEQLAEQEDQTVSQIVRRLVRQFLAERGNGQ